MKSYPNPRRPRLALPTLAALSLWAPTMRAQDRSEAVPTSVMTTVGEILPESSNANASYVSDTYSPNLIVSDTCTVSVTFLWEGAGYRNTFGYFTYQDNPDGSVTILSSDILVDNLSFPGAGSLATGDTYDLKDGTDTVRVFTAGEKIGFFVIANGFGSARSLVTGWTYSQAGVPSTNPATNAGIGLGLYTTINQLNRESIVGSGDKAAHCAMISMPGVAGFLGGEDYFLMGFEDLNRTSNSDEDFNDAVFVVKATPQTAIATTNIVTYSPGDPDGDGVLGLNDQFPNDSERAYVTRYPSSGEMVLAFEDLYPNVGDADYNDAVIAFTTTVVTDSQNRVKDIVADYHLVARGASYDHSFGLRLPNLPLTATGSVQIERYLQDLGQTNETDTRTVAAVVANGNRIDDIFESTTNALPPPSGQTFTNTWPGTNRSNAASARVRIEFTTPIASTTLGSPPYDPYLSVVRYDETPWDIHLPGFDGFGDRPGHLPAESGSTSFIDDNGFPWALLVPHSWQHPLESVDIGNAFSEFTTWRTSSGAQNTSWYLSPSSVANTVSEPTVEIIPNRDWSVQGAQ